MRAFSFLHCADLHLGAPFKDLAGLPAEFEPRLRKALTTALDRIVETAIDHNVSAVIMAGDVFDDGDRNLHAQFQLRDRLQELDEAEIRTLIVAGNHDPLNNTVSSIEYPKSVHFFGTEVDDIPLRRNDEILAHVYGVSYGARKETKNLASEFPSKPKGPFSIAVLHANVGGQASHGPYAPCELADLVEREMDYWALGHVHTRKTLREEGPVVHYPGNVQGLHRNEEGPRGATLVKVAPDRSVEISPIWTDTIRWHRRQDSINDLKAVDDIMRKFAEISAEIREDSPNQLHIVSWKLTGSGPVHAELRNPVIRAELEERLRTEHAPEPRDGAVWLRKLKDETISADIEQLRKQQDLLGNLLRLADDARNNPGIKVSDEIGNDLGSSTPNEISAAIETELEEVLRKGDIRTALGENPWNTIDWDPLLRRSELRSIEGLLGKDADS